MDMALRKSNLNSRRRISPMDFRMEFVNRVEAIFDVGQVTTKHEIQRAVSESLKLGDRSWIVQYYRVVARDLQEKFPGRICVHSIRSR